VERSAASGAGASATFEVQVIGGMVAAAEGQMPNETGEAKPWWHGGLLPTPHRRRGAR